MSNLSGIVREGWLKRVKNQKKRYFVLGFNKETGAGQLQYYENPKKFSSETVPKRIVSLQQCLGIIKKVDDKFGDILVLYTKDAVFRLKAETNDLLDAWFTDLDKLLQMEYKNLQELKYDIVWNVKVVPRGLGGVRNVTGPYKLCLKDNTLFFINPVTQEVVIEEKLYHVRKFGYSEYCVFMEFGRSTQLGAGEIWMEVDDPLIAQKIEDSLSRSVKPKSSSRPERKSMIEDSRTRVELPTSENNNDSPKTRRPTFMASLIGRKKLSKDIARPHSNSVSSVPSGSGEEITINRNGSLPRKKPCGEDEDSEEMHYPKITPPVPSVGRTKSQSSGSFTDDAYSKHRKEKFLDLELKSEQNEYAVISKPEPRQRKRTELKQDINLVRRKFVEEYNSSSLPRRTSSSSSSDPTWRRSMGSENFASGKYDDSDRDSTRESDKEDGDSAFLQQNSSQYIKMSPRQPIGSDSSADEPGAAENLGSYTPGFYPPKPSSTPDLYVHMASPRLTPNLDKPRNTSSDSYNSLEEGGGRGKEQDVSTYVNMKPGLRHARVASCTSSSSEDLPTGDTGDEMFDHLNRREQTADNYVNISPQSTSRGGLKKSRSQIQRSADSAYVNVDMNRSKSVGSKTRLFRIVSQQESVPPEDEDEYPELPSSYVNVESNGADANYANFVPQIRKQSTEKSPGKKARELNYTSVEFSKDIPPRPRDRVRPRRGNDNQENYSKIDFEKSNVLADISSSRERQLHHS